MPIYEYEPDDRDCQMCPNRLGVIQSITDLPLEYCPYCGLRVRRVISKVSFRVAKSTLATSAERGFTTWKKTEAGVWEKVSGEGADYLVGSEDDKQAIADERQAKPPLDLDEP